MRPLSIAVLALLQTATAVRLSQDNCAPLGTPEPTLACACASSGALAGDGSAAACAGGSLINCGTIASKGFG